MNEFLEKIILGIIQGLTEFIPVSSSGHLEIARILLGDSAHLEEEGMITTVVLHFATALATLVVFRRDLARLFGEIWSGKGTEGRRFALAILISMIPAVVVGLAFEKQIDSMFTGQLLLVGICLLLTGGLLLLADRARTTGREVTPVPAFLIGIAQMIAILPGISRSGATISASVLLGVDREKAARFSFLMVIPLIFGKIAKDLLFSDGLITERVSAGPLAVGFLASFVTGILACTWMIRLVKKSKLYYFTIYCVMAGLLAIGLHYFLWK